MPNTTMNDVINPQVMGDMISAKTEAMLKITPYAKVDTTLQGVPGDTKTVPSWKYIGDAEDVTEGAEVGLTSMKASSTTFTIKKAMKAVGITQEAINSGYGNPVDQAETQLAKAIAGKVDNDVFAAALKTSQVSGDGSSVIAYSGVVDIVDVFDEEDITDKALFINPKQLTKLRKDTEFISADKYNNNVMVSGEIGMICQSRIIPSKKVPKITAKVGASSDQGAVKITADNQKTYAGHVWDETNKAVITPAVDSYVVPETNAYYLCPCLKLEPADSETEFTETELPAVTIFLKKDTQTDHEWLPRKQTHEITTAKYYGVALTNEAKAVVGKFKA